MSHEAFNPWLQMFKTVLLVPGEGSMLRRGAKILWSVAEVLTQEQFVEANELLVATHIEQENSLRNPR